MTQDVLFKVSDMLMRCGYRINIFASTYFRRRKHDIVIVNAGLGIGDYTIMLGSIKHLRDYFPDRHITLVCTPSCEELAIKSGYFDEVFPLNTKFFDVLKCTGRLKCKLLFCFSFSGVYSFPALVSRNIPAAKKMACDRYIDEYINGDNILPGKELVRAEGDDKITPIPDVEAYQQFVNTYCGVSQKAHLADLSMFYSERIIEERYFVVNCGASGEERRWPVKNFVALAKYISDVYKIKCILIGSKDEILLAEEFTRSFDRNVINFVGRKSLCETIGIIANAVLTVTNDTSTFHISVSQGVPTVCIAPMNHFPRYTVYSKENTDCKIEPLIIACSMPCKGCVAHNDRAKMKKKCRSAIENKIGLYDCLAVISTEKAIEASKKYLNLYLR